MAGSATALPRINNSGRGKTRFGAPHKSIHELSVFESTGYQRPYFIIHPQWTSEARGAKRLSLRERGYHSWDCRPAYNPLKDYLEPITPRNAQKDYSDKKSRMQMLQDQIEKQKVYESQEAPLPQHNAPCAGRSKLLKPVTPKDRNGNVAREYTIY